MLRSFAPAFVFLVFFTLNPAVFAGETVGEEPLRVVDIFDDSLLDAPLELDVADPAPLLDADFEEENALTLWRFRTPEGARVALAESGHAGRRSLVIETAGENAVKLPRAEQNLAVKPETTYRMTAWVRTEALVPHGDGSAGAAVEVFEFATQKSKPLVTHQHLPRARGTSEWRQLDYSFKTSEATRHISVRLVPVVNGTADGSAFFDDVRLVEVPRITELLQKDALRTKARSKVVHPLVKRVSLDRYEYRPAILSPVSMSWSVPVAASSRMLLRLALGAVDLGGVENPASARACFRIEWVPTAASGPAAAAKTLLDRCISSRPATWYEESLPLAPYAGQSGVLRFQSTLDPGIAGYWGNPQWVLTERDPGDERPNILLLVYDTLRADHLGYDGYGRSTSPTLDALAKRSVRYRRAYTVSPWTAPSLSSLMTSRYPSQHRGGLRIERERRHREPQRPEDGEAARGWENRLLGDLFQRVTALNYHSIKEDEVTLAERLRSQGYSTVGFHSNYNSSGILGLSRGFDRYRLFSGIAPEGAGAGVGMVRRWLQDRRNAGEEGPFLILLHTQDAHIPYRLRPAQEEEFGPVPEQDGKVFRTVPWGPKNWAVEFWDFEILRTGKAREHVEAIKRFYDSEIAFADKAMSALIQDLDENLPNTAIAVVSDHGEEFDEHGQFEHGHSLYDEVLRVPLLLRLPDERHAGMVIDEPVSILDLAPTLLQLADAPEIPNSEGRALVSADPTKRQRKRDAIFAEAMLRGPDRSAVIDGSYKYIYHHPLGYLDPYPRENFLEGGVTAKTGREELFHLGEDPAEKKDLSEEKPEITTRFRAKLFNFMAETSHGIHLRCGGDAELTIAFSETLAQIKPMALEEEDFVEIDDERRQVVLRLKEESAGEHDWLIARVLRPDARVAIRATSKVRLYLGASDKPASKRGVEFALGDAEVLGVPTSMPDKRDSWCRVWSVPGGDASSVETLDNEVAEQLKALGYM